jgi:GT2 family glycosyltransferase
MNTSPIYPTISICSVSMNRSHHVRETLPANIAENSDYPSIEFVLLDYNSTDGLEDWVRSKMMGHIEKGVLKYYRTDEPEYFNVSHAKNMVTNLCSGRIICNVDADNYAGCGYASWVYSVFSGKENRSLVTTIQNGFIKFRDQGGKLAFYSDSFKKVRGYDEDMIGYGFEDVDLVYRLEGAGNSSAYIEDPKYLKYIDHPDMDRLRNYHLINNLEGIFIEASAPRTETRRALYLLCDNSFFEVAFEFDESLRSDQYLTRMGWKISKDNGRAGLYGRVPEGFLLRFDEGGELLYRKMNEGTLSTTVGSQQTVWDKIPPDFDLFTNLIMLYTECANRLKFSKNKANRGSVNSGGWGRGVVYRNFEKESPISSGYGI